MISIFLQEYLLIISTLIYYNNKYIKNTIYLVLRYVLNAISLEYQLTIKNKRNENSQIKKPNKRTRK